MIMAADQSALETRIERFEGTESSSMVDLLAAEEPLEIQLAHGPIDRREVKAISVTMRTPGCDCELAAGFLMTEGVLIDSAAIARIRHVVRSSAGVRSIRHNAQESRGTFPYQSGRNIIRVELMPEVHVNLATLERNFYITSGCGICGKASLLALRTVCPGRRANDFNIAAEDLYKLPTQLRALQNVFEVTGGLHAAALFDTAGCIGSIREDVGRHNAVDKLLGAEFLADRTPLRERGLMLSGRASFELLQKALMGGIPMVVSVGAPSNLAVQVAKEFDITLVGFLRKDRFNVYHGAPRITSVRKEIN